MLKPVVENVDGGAQARFGERARCIAIGADHHGDALSDEGSRQHQRLIAGGVDAGEHMASIRDDPQARA